MENLYNASKAAERLGMTNIMVAKYCRHGRIEAIKFGNAWLISEESLVAFERIPRGTPGPGRPKQART